MTLSAPRVLPWKPLTVVTISVLPCARASFNAASVASAPELTKCTRSRPAGVTADSAAAACTPAGSKKTRVDIGCVSICRCTAAVTSGCRCPSRYTPVAAEVQEAPTVRDDDPGALRRDLLHAPEQTAQSGPPAALVSTAEVLDPGPDARGGHAARPSSSPATSPFTCAQ